MCTINSMTQYREKKKNILIMHHVYVVIRVSFVNNAFIMLLECSYVSPPIKLQTVFMPKKDPGLLQNGLKGEHIV